MSETNDRRSKSLCLIALDSKRNVSFDGISGVVTSLARYGYYFDKISRVGYDNSKNIARALSNARNCYENVIIFCPSSMKSAVSEFVKKLYGAAFDRLNCLTCGSDSVFMMFDDAQNRLTVEDVIKVLNDKYSLAFGKLCIRACGAPTALVSKAIGDAKKLFDGRSGGEDIYFHVEDRFDDCAIEIVYSVRTHKMLLDDVQRVILAKLNDYVYALEDVTLAEQLFRLLSLRRMKICVAESFTGGGVGKKIVEVPGASEVFVEGLNTYSSSSKIQRLGVDEMVLKQYGAVSAETCYQMAEGLLKNGNCDVAISTTGLAGPKSDNTSKPVGLAYIGVGIGSDVAVYEFHFSGDREKITCSAINHALFLAYKRLK